MGEYVILTDSSADLSAELVAELGVEVLPLSFTMEDKIYYNWPDNRDIDPADFYARLRGGAMATTSAVNVATYTDAIEPFLKDFDMYFCKLFDGARHDSGDPFRWGELMIEHWRRNKCDPHTKNLIFSDALTVPRILELFRRFHGRVGLGFGIGTNLMNDRGPQPLNVVIKMVACNGQPVAKISDSPEKGMCEDESYLKYLRQVFGIEEPVCGGAAVDRT